MLLLLLVYFLSGRCHYGTERRNGAHATQYSANYTIIYLSVCVRALLVFPPTATIITWYIQSMFDYTVLCCFGSVLLSVHMFCVTNTKCCTVDTNHRFCLDEVARNIWLHTKRKWRKSNSEEENLHTHTHI